MRSAGRPGKRSPSSSPRQPARGCALAWSQRCTLRPPTGVASARPGRAYPGVGDRLTLAAVAAKAVIAARDSLVPSKQSPIPSLVEIAHPDTDRMPCSEADGPGIAVVARRPGLDRGLHGQPRRLEREPVGEDRSAPGRHECGVDRARSRARSRKCRHRGAIMANDGRVDRRRREQSEVSSWVDVHWLRPSAAHS